MKILICTVCLLVSAICYGQQKPAKIQPTPVAGVQNQSVDGPGALRLYGYSGGVFPMKWELRKGTENGTAVSKGSVEKRFDANSKETVVSNLSADKYYLITTDAKGLVYINEFIIQNNKTN